MREAMLWETIDGNRIHCFLCAHHCTIAPSKFGICRVRRNVDGALFTHAYGTVVSAAVDPVEKKPLYHFHPGTTTYSVATVGCNFRCGFCQNWQISQLGAEQADHGQKMSPEQVVRNAHGSGCKSIAFTYTEPTIFFEYAFDIARLAHAQGLPTIFVTNGYMTAEALETVAPYLDACNVDLKSFSDDFYRRTCKGRLQPVLDSLRRIRNAGIWLEITTLLIPGENDSDEELNRIAGFIAGLGPDIPWHVSRFFPQYEYTGHDATTVGSVLRAREIGIRHGLRYVYTGNVPGKSSTYCPNCNSEVLERDGYRIHRATVNQGKCGVCGSEIAGRW